ncbi:unnamed protein product, partial [Symbiodinium sp. KB8]
PACMRSADPPSCRCCWRCFGGRCRAARSRRPSTWYSRSWRRLRRTVASGAHHFEVSHHVRLHLLLNFQRITVFYPPTLKAGEVWRLWTHALLHSDLGHLAVNMLHILNTLDLEGVVLGWTNPSADPW